MNTIIIDGKRDAHRRTATRTFIGLLAVALSMAALVGLSGTTANAWSVYSPSGYTGAVSLNPTVANGGARFTVGAISVSRNGTVAVPYPQPTEVTAQLQYARNGVWVLADQFTQTVIIPSTSSSAWSTGFELTPRYNGIGAWTGLYPVVYIVKWTIGWNPTGGGSAVNGSEVIVPTQSSDLRCGVTTCRAYAGYLQIL